jgi:flagellar motor switch/type III secretory pathway protein FliN
VSPTESGQTPKPWLPNTTLRDGKLRGVLEGVVSAWSNHWFAPTYRELGVTQIGGSGQVQEHGLKTAWSSGHSDLCLAISDKGRRELASAMLAINMEQHRFTKHDAQMIVKLTDPIIEDLMTRLLQLLHLEALVQQVSSVDFGSHVERDYEMFSINSDNSVRAIDIYVRNELANRARLQLIPPIRPQPSFSPKSLAISHQEIKIGACVGSTQLSYAELCNLCAGDVVVLSRNLNENFQVTVDGQICDDILCETQEKDGQTKLRIFMA